MATKKQKEELIEILKFTPRTYNIHIGGYGGECYAGTVDRKIYDYFKEHKIDISEYANDWDDRFVFIPEDLRPFTSGSPYDCDNLFHASGAELSDLNEIQVYDEKGNDHWSCAAGFNDLEDAGVTVSESGGSELDDLEEGTVVFWGGSGEKGTFFDGEIELREPFDPKKLSVYYENCDGWWIITGVEYDGEEIDGTGGYSTTGKWAEQKWVLCSDEEVYEPVSLDEQEDNSDKFLEEAADAINETFADELASSDKDPLEVMYGYTEWYPVDIKPIRKGMYECEFESTTWPFPIERMCEWTGRSWKEDGKKAIGIKRWRGLASEPYEGD
jgi:hypothetical protein